MEQLIQILKNIPEYTSVLECIGKNRSAAITGIGQINRSHLIAGFVRHTGRPVVIACQDDMAAKRLQSELQSFLGQDVPVLPSRELTLYDSAVVSRAWEQKRLRQFFDLTQGTARIQIMSYEALSMRTMPPQVLKEAAFTLEVGREYVLEELLQHLTQAGYSRCGMVEGPG